MKKGKTLATLVRALDAVDAGARRLAIESLHRDGWSALWTRGEGRATPAVRREVFARLVGLLRDVDAAVRFEAAYVLSRWYERRAARALLAIVGRADEGPRLRGQCAEGVGDILCAGTGFALRDEAIAVLRRSLKDAAAEVRFWAARALGIMRAQEAKRDLGRLARTDDAFCPDMWAVRDEAADALIYMRTKVWPDRAFASRAQSTAASAASASAPPASSSSSPPTPGDTQLPT